jgi:hypothetical protein
MNWKNFGYLRQNKKFNDHYIILGFATGLFLVQGVLPTALGLRNWSETKRFMAALCSKVGATGNI